MLTRASQARGLASCRTSPVPAAAQWIKEGKQAVKVTRLSCNRFRSDEVRLWLSVIAYNLDNL
ncbi:MAG: hypothetical protein ABSA41_01705 [Terriglobia bacterium]